MIRETLSQTDQIELPLIAFVIFLVTFVIVVVRVVLRSRAEQINALRDLPLAADTAPEHSRER